MTTRLTVWGTGGRIYADRQECQAYLRGTAPIPEGYREGWNVRFATELTEPVWFYLRGEEYSAQIDAFVRRVEAGREDGVNGFASAAVTDRSIAMLAADAARDPLAVANDGSGAARPAARPGWRRRLRRAA